MAIAFGHRTLLLLLALSTVILGGCASFTKRLEVSTVAKIHPSQTTRAQVEDRLGPPKETVVGANGVTVARYFFHEFRPVADVSVRAQWEHPGDILFRTLTLRYGSSNVVEEKLHDESVTPIYRTNAWFFAGPALTPESVKFIERDVAKETDVVAKLGEPAVRTFDGAQHPVLVWFSVRTRETRWADPTVQRLMVVLDANGVVRDYVLVENPLSEFEPLRLH